MRTNTLRTLKYKNKIAGRVIPQQKMNFANAVGEQVRIEQEIKQFVGGQASTLELPYYIIFTKELIKLTKKYRGQNLINEMEILQNRWTSRGLNMFVLRFIKSHYVPEYPLPDPFIMDSSLLDGFDALY